MKVLLLQVEKTQETYISQGIEAYSERLKNYTQLDTYTITMPVSVRRLDAESQKKAESTQILKQIQPQDHLVLLDENGKQMSSEEFAKFIESKQLASLKRLVFVIGGPYGFHASVYERANFKLSLSRMTFSHQMVRLFFLEQLYRAHTILRGEKYHHR